MKNIKETQILLDIEYKDYMRQRFIKDDFEFGRPCTTYRYDIAYEYLSEYSSEDLINELISGFSDYFYEAVAKDILIQRKVNLDNLIFL